MRVKIAILAISVVGVGLLMYWPTLGLSFGYDDIDYLNQAADVLAGKQGFWSMAFRPQGEHVLPVFRTAWLLNAAVFGTETPPYRLLVLLSHAATAFFLGLICLRYERRLGVALACGVSYVGAAGFSSMWIWFPSGSAVPFSVAAISGSIVALTFRDRLGIRNARLMAAGCVLLALGCETTLAPLVAIPGLVEWWERRRSGNRSLIGWFEVFCLVAMIGAALLGSILYSITFGPRLSVNLAEGIPRAAFLMLVAPFRLVFPGFPLSQFGSGAALAVYGSLCGLVVALPLAALLMVLWRRGAPQLATMSLLTALGPIGVVGLVGVGRWSASVWELYYADRYFFTLMIPISLLVGAVAGSFGRLQEDWGRLRRLVFFALVVAAAGTEFVLHQKAMLARIPFDIYENHEERFEQLHVLSERLSQAALALPAGREPLRFPDSRFWFPDVHNGHLTSRFFLHVIGHGAGDRLELGGARVSSADAEILNPLLEGWAREIGEPLPYLSIVDGALTDAHVVSRVDFRISGDDHAVVSGFFGWEGGYRWMGRRGVLRLTMVEPGITLLLAAPIGDIKASGAGIESLALRVGLIDEATGVETPIGTLEVLEEGPQLYRLDGTMFFSKLGAGRTVHLILEATETWRPEQVLVDSRDTRELSVTVLSAGFGETD